jgi:predicted exporter
VERRDRLVLLLGLAVVAAMAFYLHRELRISSGLADLMVDGSARDGAAISSALLDSPLTRTMTLSVSADSLATAVEAIERWKPTLCGHPEVETCRSGPDPDLARAFHEIYFPRRLGFAELEGDGPSAPLGDQQLVDSARRLKRGLAGPRGDLIKALSPADPLMIFLDQVERLERGLGPGMTVVRGQFVAPEERAAILFLKTRHSPFDSEHQRPFDDFVQRSFRSLQSEFGPDLDLQRSGVHRFAVASEARARRDMERISALSSAAVALLFLAAFGSIRILLLAAIPLGIGVLSGAVVTVAIFGEIHLITMVFGSTLVGVCIDYPIHYFAHLRPAIPSPDRRRVIATIRGPLVLGAVTSALGFGVLATSAVPGIREMGVFAAVGVLAALAATCWLLPPLAETARPGGLLGRWARRPAAPRSGLSPRVCRLALAAMVLAAAPGIVHTEWEDDVFALNPALRPDWISEDQRIRDIAGRMDLGRFVVVFASDRESALEGNDAVHHALEPLVRSGELEGTASIHALLPSAREQRRRATELRRRIDVDRFRAAYESEGFRTERFAPFFEALRENHEPLRWDDISTSPVADLATPFLLSTEDGFAALTFVRGVSDPGTIQEAIAGVDGARYFDQRSVLRDLYRQYRRQSLVLVAVGILAVAGLLWIRFRDLGKAAALMAPAILAAGCTVGLLGAVGVSLNLVHLLGLLLVSGIGVDYAVFLLTGSSDGHERRPVQASLTIAAASTSLVFGMLCVSPHPVLRSLGAATCLGVAISLLTTFLVDGATRDDPERPA